MSNLIDLSIPFAREYIVNRCGSRFVEDGITIPPKPQPVDVQTAKRRLVLFMAACAMQGKLS